MIQEFSSTMTLRNLKILGQLARLQMASELSKGIGKRAKTELTPYNDNYQRWAISQKMDSQNNDEAEFWMAISECRSRADIDDVISGWEEELVELEGGKGA